MSLAEFVGSGSRASHLHLTAASVFPHQLFGSGLFSELLGIKPGKRGRQPPPASKQFICKTDHQ